VPERLFQSPTELEKFMKSECFLKPIWFMNSVGFVEDGWPEKFWLTAHYVCRVQQVSGPQRIATKCRGMEEAQNDSSSENEAKGMDVHLGVEGSNSNGHGEEIDNEGNMMKIIERLQKDAQTHRADNKNLRKDQEK
jgi:hypothetical protein